MKQRVWQGLCLCLLGAMLLGGCHHVTYRTDKIGEDVMQEGSNRFFFWGLAGIGEIDLKRVCPGGVSRIHVYQTFLDGFLGVITIGIFIPRTWEVRCAAASGNSPPPQKAPLSLPPSDRKIEPPADISAPRAEGSS